MVVSQLVGWFSGWWVGGLALWGWGPILDFSHGAGGSAQIFPTGGFAQILDFILRQKSKI